MTEPESAVARRGPKDRVALLLNGTSERNLKFKAHFHYPPNKGTLAYGRNLLSGAFTMKWAQLAEVK